MNKRRLIILPVTTLLSSILLLACSTPWLGYRFLGTFGTSMNPVISEEDIVNNNG